MPYMLVSSQIRLDSGPTIVGDGESNLDLMTALGAVKSQDPISKIITYKTAMIPRLVLNRLEGMGWTVISSTGVGQTCVWTLHKHE